MHLDPVSREKLVRDFQSSPPIVVLMSIVGLSNYSPVSIKPQGIVAVQTSSWIEARSRLEAHSVGNRQCCLWVKTGNTLTEQKTLA